MFPIRCMTCGWHHCGLRRTNSLLSSFVMNSELGSLFSPRLATQPYRAFLSVVFMFQPFPKADTIP